ncbi:hypothetical protein BHYA_0274g00130 [Botrytis hyacinthi]|uniref:Uncharacterized protein n=1 Tax=Botrytis hyacinthi TaxID=278943 RepID=A0A4Z1GD74_9HELO|nr:hypothetical protein BHYA_0274g00130 [Botrytis hyacinthi]
MSAPSMSNDLVHCQGKIFMTVPSAKTSLESPELVATPVTFYVDFKVFPVAFAPLPSGSAFLSHPRVPLKFSE